MANAYIDSTLVDKAVIFAVKAHSNTERRGKGFPYIIHPLEAMAIVATITGDQELLAAAALHDVVEDTDCDIETIRAEFGDRIAGLVKAETDDLGPEAGWKERKAAAVKRIAESSHDSKITSMGDKLSNMRAMAQDYKEIGDKLWKRFHCDDPAQIGWYYRSLAEALSELSDTAAYREFVRLIDETFGNQANEL